MYRFPSGARKFGITPINGDQVNFFDLVPSKDGIRFALHPWLDLGERENFRDRRRTAPARLGTQALWQAEVACQKGRRPRSELVCLNALHLL